MTDSLPRYLYFNADKNYYRFDCPTAYCKMGVTKRRQFSGSRRDEAIAYAIAENVNIDEYQKETKFLKSMNGASKVEHLINDYKRSPSFVNLAANTQQSYINRLAVWINRRYGGMTIGKMRLDFFTTPVCQKIYDDYVAEGNIAQSKEALGAYRMLFNFAIRRGYINVNPFEKVRTVSHKPRKVMWQREHVRAFLNVAFSKWQWRSVGVIVYCAYEWGQRVGDMRTLRWSNIDFDNKVLRLTQSKRGASVEIPISDGLISVLKQQHHDFGWQEYVAPKLLKRQNDFATMKPYSLLEVSGVCRTIVKEADLPSELQVRDLRRTAITELVDQGTPIPSIMSISGHTSVHSLTPYIKHTLRGATNAQQMRAFPSSLL